ncbi:MAG: penicillin-binding protein 2 [Thermoleophilaceae bacterium]|jgi:penicillin-binding protein 2|nr:penicillin-binding protein 2 [Thermoleophilaceae bacterium]
MYLDNERRPTLTPQLAVRVAILGGIALAAFAVIFFRLWFLQVLSGDKYVAEAQGNQLRQIRLQAPRGDIVDREGRLLVSNRVGLAVELTPDKLSPDRAERRRLYRRLGRLLGMRPRAIERHVNEQFKEQRFSKATVKQDVSRDVVMYIEERQEDFRGVEVDPVFLRQYPHAQIGAHLFGYVGEVSAEELNEPGFREVRMGDRVGKAGLESEYDQFLRGKSGKTRVQVDAFGNLRRPLGRELPTAGSQLRLSLDLDVQRAGQEALAGGTGKGAFAVMDIHNGEVLGLGSEPSYDPNLFAKIVRERDFKRLTADETGAPLTNRAVAAGYPTGSTFKLITATAALESGLITPDTPLNDPGELTVGDQVFKNAGGVAHGVLSLRQALTVSSDVFFYQLGRDLNEKGMPLQHWARELGLGHRTGIDLPEEGPGFVPGPKWRDRQYAKFERCKNRTHPTYTEITQGKCGWQDRPWSVGDNVNLAVGQGDLAANPLQMAVAYAAIATGRVRRPRLGQRIENSAGQVKQQLEALPARKLGVSLEYRQAILDGLRGAASAPGGTSTPVFSSFPVEIAGKTGTAEHLGRPDQSWYVALAPWPDPKYVVAVTDEAGGFGADTAAPMARRILAALFNVDEKQLVQGGGPSD